MSIVPAIQWHVVECILSTHVKQLILVIVLATMVQTGVFLVSWVGLDPIAGQTSVLPRSVFPILVE